MQHIPTKGGGRDKRVYKTMCYAMRSNSGVALCGAPIGDVELTMDRKGAEQLARNAAATRNPDYWLKDVCSACIEKL